MKSILKYLRQKLLRKLEKPRHDYEQRTYNNMSKLYGVIQPGDVVLVEGRSEMSRLIKLFSNSHWSHVAMYVGPYLVRDNVLEKNLYLSKFNKSAHHMIVEAYSGKGVIAEPLEKYKNYNIRICRPYGIEKTDLENVIQDIMTKIGNNYDDQNIIELALMGLQTVFHSRNKISLKACLGNCNDFQVICSGMIAQAFQKVGYPILPSIEPSTRMDEYSENNPYGGCLRMKHYTQIFPKDFDLSPNFEVIKHNLIGVKKFDYKLLWVDRIGN